MRVDGSIGPAIRTGRDLSGRERGERRLSADLANQTHAGAQCGAALFGREKILPDATGTPGSGEASARVLLANSNVTH
jgi:hypothetical protein